MKIISVVNQKGGVGKSTIAQIIGNYKRLEGYKPLFIDLDQQGNLTYITGYDYEGNQTAYDLLKGDTDINNAIYETEQGDLISSSNNLARIESELQQVGKEFKLKEGIEQLQTNYDYVIIDTPPSLSTVVINALTVSNDVVIPTQADILSIQGLGKIGNTIQAVRQYTNSGLNIAGLLVTRFNSRTILGKQLSEMIDDTAKQLGTKTFQTKIREAVAVQEAQAYRTNIFDYAPKSKVTSDYEAFMQELDI